MYTHPAIKTPVPSARLGKITSFALAYMVLGSCCPQNASLYPMPQTKNTIPAIITPNFITPSRIPSKEVAIKWSAAPDMTPQTVLYRRPVAQFSNFQPKIVSSWLILALFQANFLISGRSRLCPYQLVNSNQVRQGE